MKTVEPFSRSVPRSGSPAPRLLARVAAGAAERPCRRWTTRSGRTRSRSRRAEGHGDASTRSRPENSFPARRTTIRSTCRRNTIASRPIAFMIFLDGSGYAGNNVRVPVVLDNLIARHELPPMIAIFIDPGRDAGAVRSGAEPLRAHLRVRLADAAVRQLPDRRADARGRPALQPLDGSQRPRHRRPQHRRRRRVRRGLESSGSVSPRHHLDRQLRQFPGRRSAAGPDSPDRAAADPRSSCRPAGRIW